jgi:uncharacterized protein
MKSVFIDTSFVIAMFTPEDKHHKQAVEIARDLFDYQKIWITDAVLYEIGNSFVKSNKKIVAEFIQDCYNTDQIEVVKTDELLLLRALERYATYLDKDWSLTDCISFEVMKEYGIDKAYSSDHHFGQAGFQYMLR